MTLSFELPDYPILGEWRLRVQALTQIEDKTIVVEQYFMPRFEVSQESDSLLFYGDMSVIIVSRVTIKDGKE